MTIPRYPDVVREGYDAAPGETNPYPRNSILWDMREAGRRMREMGQPLVDTITHGRARSILRAGTVVSGSRRPERV